MNRLFPCNVAGAAVLINSHVVQFHIFHLRHVVSFYKNESQITPTDQNLHAFSFSWIKCDVFELQIWQLCLLMSPLTWKCEKNEEWMSEKNWHSLQHSSHELPALYMVCQFELLTGLNLVQVKVFRQSSRRSTSLNLKWLMPMFMGFQRRPR